MTDRRQKGYGGAARRAEDEPPGHQGEGHGEDERAQVEVLLPDGAELFQQLLGSLGFVHRGASFSRLS
jgi:hypothetical protein